MHLARRRARSVVCERLEDRQLFSVLPNGFSESVVASSLSGATAMEFSPDGKLFVAEQGGTMEVWQNGSRLQANFFQNTPLTTQTVSERGLLGIAFDPAFANNRFVYVYYTTTATDAHNRISRFTANATGDLALAGSETILMELDAHSAGNHNGGAMHFGTDGKLYIATGDNALGSNAQSLANRHGKMLRINADGSIPDDNPTTFAGIQGSPAGANRAIWAVGLRNPFTFAFRPGSSQMFINDVGQGTWEEINEGGAGRNFGWSTTEGDFNQASFPNFTRPFYTYDHGGAEPNGVAITGGAFYNPTTNQFGSDYLGDYFFADFGSNEIWRIDTSTKALTKFATGASAPVDLKVDAAGNLYYLARGSGQVFRVSFSSQPPVITDQPDSITVTTTQSATFTVVASGAGPLTYQWQRAESGTTAFSNIQGATGTSYTLTNAQSGDNGDRFRVVVTDSLQRSTNSNFATLTVNANQPPVAGIAVTGGLRNGRWDAGTVVNFSGSATDPEQGTLPASAYSWRVDYLTTINGGDADGDGLPGLTRPFVPNFGNTTASNFTPATTGPYTLTDVAYVITLTVTDAQGRTDTERLVLNPNTVNLTVNTNPAGLGVTVDGQPFTGPYTFGSVVGFQRPIGTIATQSVGGVTYNFVAWNNGSQQLTRTIATPTTNTSYLANFQAAPATNYVARVNFQTTSSAGFAGYVADTGAVFGSRGNGFSYGWNIDNAANARNRNNASSPDERYDTLNHIQKAGGANRWEFALANGTYTVRVVAGDPSNTDQINHLQVEAIQLRDPDGNDNFDEYTATVTVSDGRLTIIPGSGASNAKLCFIDISTATVATNLKVNFQNTGSLGFAGYLADTGLVYGNRGNGWTYGWNLDNTAFARNRNATNSPDERYDTFNHLQKSGGGSVWEAAVPNGSYTVRIVAGDATNFDSVYRINAEGVLAVSGTPTSANRWVEGTVTVLVSDGRLTISNGSGAVNNKIAFIEILSV